MFTSNNTKSENDAIIEKYKELKEMNVGQLTDLKNENFKIIQEMRSELLKVEQKLNFITSVMQGAEFTKDGNGLVIWKNGNSWGYYNPSAGLYPLNTLNPSPMMFSGPVINPGMRYGNPGFSPFPDTPNNPMYPTQGYVPSKD